MSLQGVSLGVLLHAIGGVAAGSFYIPYKQVRGWAWESYWIVGGTLTWIIMPWLIAWVTVPDLILVLRTAPPGSIAMTFLMGAMWGIGGLTFGLSIRYLGISLGMAISLGTCAVFGTLIPPLCDGTFMTLLSSSSGTYLLTGLTVCLGGIVLCTIAGSRREQELAIDRADEKSTRYSKGIWVATFAGVMSACFALAIMSGKPIGEAAERLGTDPFHRNAPVLVVLFTGGFLLNLTWCLALNFHNGTISDYVHCCEAPLWRNYVFSALAGTIAYLEFFFYGMATTQMGRYDFSSWTIHMSFVIVFSNLWGIWFREWSGTSSRTRLLNYCGLCVLVASTIIVGYGNSLTVFTLPIGPEL
ncbi:L-rhamnose/proton symporter RhaT [Planctomicrobium sp. SH661]|uniref:L-rhamnose/proton symporter RhaT n=1 Tax=Planctomicrobium sp. SH661 TaxID=3448124 RepID=UPI003F5C5C7E